MDTSQQETKVKNASQLFPNYLSFKVEEINKTRHFENVLNVIIKTL